MAEAGVEVVGADALAHDLARFSSPQGALSASLDRAGRQAIEPVAAAVRSSLPRDSGALAGSVRVGNEPAGASVTEGEGLLYAGPVDFGGWPEGREYIAAGRYLFPAFAHVEPTAVDLYSSATQRALDSFSWSHTGTS